MLARPRTIREAQQARYGAWAGEPSGRSWRNNRCAYEVVESGRGSLFRQCFKKPGYGPGELYCKVHAKRLDNAGC